MAQNPVNALKITIRNTKLQTHLQYKNTLPKNQLCRTFQNPY